MPDLECLTFRPDAHQANNKGPDLECLTFRPDAHQANNYIGAWFRVS